MIARNPNILWVLTTQWRAQATGFCRDPNASTPHLDRLAREGLVVAQATTPHPFGPFARAAILTGKLSPHNGVRDYFDPLPPGEQTVAHAMGALGYKTSFFGKWHLGQRDPAAPLVGEEHARIVVPESGRGGFDFWEGFESGFLLNDPWLHGTRLPEPTRFPGYQSRVVCERAGSYLSGQTGPWFSVVSLEAPHPPYGAPSDGVAARPPGQVVLRGNVPSDPQVTSVARRELSGYYAHIEATDRALGALLAAVGDDAAVVVTSVHGDMHGSHGLFRKGWPHEESVRVPLVIRAPGARGVHPGAFCLSQLPDITRSMARGPLLIPPNPSVRISMPSVVRLPHQCDQAWTGFRSPSEKLILGENGRPWLYFDLAKDPLEQVNLVSSPAHSQRVRELASAV